MRNCWKSFHLDTGRILITETACGVTLTPYHRYLAYCQEATMGVRVIRDLPGHRRENDSLNGRAHDKVYMQSKAWVEGESIDF